VSKKIAFRNRFRLYSSAQGCAFYFGCKPISLESLIHAEVFMKSFRFTSVFLFVAATAFNPMHAHCQASSTLPTPPVISKSFDASIIDKTADPCVDFYQYSCGNWLAANPIPSDQVRWSRSFSLLRERNRYLLWQELDAAAKAPLSPLQKQFGDFYASCMDTDLIEKMGIQPIQPAWKSIAAVADGKQLPALLAHLESDGTPDGFFELSVDQDEKDSTKQIATLLQGGLSLPDRDYYLIDSPRFTTIRAQYVEHLKKMFILTGDAPAQAAKEADDVLRIETAMAKASLSRTEMRQPENRYHIYTVADLAKLTPAFDWSVYFHGVRIGSFDTLNVGTPEYFKALDGLLQTEPISAWKSYLRWHVLHGQANNLPKAFFDENFNFFAKTLSGQQQPIARWKQCASLTDGALGEAVGQDWVQRNFPPQAKQSMDKLVAALEKSLGDDIKTLPWMSEETKKAAEEKLSLIRNKIGYPEKWRDYSSVKVNRSDLVGNVRHAIAFEHQYNFAKLGKPVDEKEWDMTPPTVNAYYDPSFNDINFPAGILQPPFFDFTVDPAVNFGGIGVVIGHEMTHGFDDQGTKFDGHGNLREWQKPEDRKAFTERTDCLADEYGSFEAAPATANHPAVKLNGKLTLGENTADNGGLLLAFMAYMQRAKEDHLDVDKKIDGFTGPQRFYIGFAQNYCSNERPEATRSLVLQDPHSPDPIRVNGTMVNQPGFAAAFGCKKPSPMVPANSCRIW
jgi:putative endopeptidase